MIFVLFEQLLTQLNLKYIIYINSENAKPLMTPGKGNYAKNAIACTTYTSNIILYCTSSKVVFIFSWKIDAIITRFPTHNENENGFSHAACAEVGCEIVDLRRENIINVMFVYSFDNKTKM